MRPQALPARVIHNRRRLLRRGLYVLDRRFLRRRRRYFLQAMLAAATLAVVISIEDALSNAAIITAVASTGFIVFMAPHSRMASPRRVLGGHGVALIIGLVMAVIVHDVANEPNRASLVTDIAAALGVGFAMLGMAATDTEHPPAAGTVLGMILAPNALTSGLLVISAALVLSTVRAVFRPWLIDLTH